MSRTELYTVDKEGNVQPHAGFPNASRGAMILWLHLSKRYLSGHMPGLFGDCGALWDLAQDPRLLDCERILFASTMDGAIVRKERIPELVHNIRRWDEVANDSGHWLDQAEVLERLCDNPDVIGVCWNQTSVNPNPWVHYPKCSTCRRDEAEYIPYNVDKGTKHHYVFGYAEEQASI